MAHGSNNDGTDRESSSLFRATEGVNPSDVGKKNLSLASRKNNPDWAPSKPVKHSDFFVDKITGISSSKVKLRRSETTTIVVGFEGAHEGFLEESRYAPQNFTWVISDSTKATILETSSTSGTYTDGSHRAYKVTLKNIWNKCGSDEETITVTCRFKDEFNNNLSTADGYDTVHSVNITLRAVDITNNISYIANGNTSNAHAWDNLIYSKIGSPEGKNYSPDQVKSIGGQLVGWHNKLAKNGRVKEQYVPTADINEIILQSRFIAQNPGAGWSNDNSLVDGITNINHKWQKKVNNSWVDVLGTGNEDQFFPQISLPGAGDSGSFECYIYDSITNRVHIQSSFGTGEYRNVATLSGDSQHPWTCTYTSDVKEVTIYEPISSVSVNGEAYVCSSDTTSTITASIAPHNGSNIRYNLYRKKGRGQNQEELVESKTSTDTNGVSFEVPVSLGDGYYMVYASYVSPIHHVSNNSGGRWSQSKIEVPTDWKTPGTGVATKYRQWLDRSSAMRRVLTAQGAPNLSVEKREGPARNIITFNIQSEDVTLPPYHVFDDVAWQIEAVDVEGTKTVPFPWSSVDLGGPSKRFTKTCPVGSTITISARITVKGDMSSLLVAPGQTNNICSSPLATDETFSIDCTQTCFIAPQGSPKKKGWDGDVDVLVWEDRGLESEEFSERSVYPEGSAVMIEKRVKDPISPSIDIKNSSTAMASNVTIIENGVTKNSFSLAGVETKSHTFTNKSNKWEVEIVSGFGEHTPSNINYPRRYYTRRINR